MKAILIALALIGLVVDGTLPEKDLDDLLTVLEKKLGKIESLKSEFVQEKHLSLFEEKIESRGILLFQRPDQLRFEITKPFCSVLIANKRSVAKFESMDGQWVKLKMGGRDTILMVLEQIGSWLQGRFRDKEEIYEISARRGEALVLVLTPKDSEFKKHLAAIELTLAQDRSCIEKVVLRESGSDYTVIRFTSQDLNAPLDTCLFDTKGETPVQVPDDLFSSKGKDE